MTGPALNIQDRADRRLFAAGGQGVVAQPGVQMFQFCVALVAGMTR